MATLKLTLKKKWYDMIASGEKKEEYREIKKHWISRLMDSKSIVLENFKTIVPGTTKTMFEVWRKSFDFVEFKNGYGKDAPKMLFEFKGLSIGEAKPEWSDNWQGEVFIIKLGNQV